ncbi:MAG TPA: outer membrane beta-barrel protein [Pirellulales bacterium]
MTTNRLAVAAAFYGLLLANPLLGQQPPGGQLFAPPGFARPVADVAPPDSYDPGFYQQTKPAAPAPVVRQRQVVRPRQSARPKFGSISASFARQECPPPEEEKKEEEEKPCVQCKDGPLGCFGCGCCNVELDEPFKLGDQLHCFKKHEILVAGWIAQSYTWNPYNPSDGFNGPVTWTDQANRYQLNELYLYAVKPVDTKGEGWDYGGRVDLLYGTNYRWDTEAGLETHLNSGKFYGLAIPQFYGEVGYNDLKVIVGHFISPVGFYTVGTYNNFFNTIPYTYQYGEPFTHTGLLARYQVTEKINAGAGLIHGWDDFDSSFNKWGGYLGTLTVNGNADDSLAFVQVYSHEPTQNAARPFTQRYFQTLVYSRPLKKISDKLTYIIQSDFGVQGEATLTGKTARWYGINQYLYWKKNDLWSWGVNFEWFRDEEGFRVTAAVPSPGSPNAIGWPRGPGFAGNFYQITFGPRWTPLPNVVVRPNFRADWYHGPNNVENLRPFDGGRRNLQQILATDVIITF